MKNMKIPLNSIFIKMINNSKKEKAFDVALMIKQFFHPNDNIYNNNKYINFSIYNNLCAEYAAVVLTYLIKSKLKSKLIIRGF